MIVKFHIFVREQPVYATTTLLYSTSRSKVAYLIAFSFLHYKEYFLRYIIFKNDLAKRSASTMQFKGIGTNDRWLVDVFLGFINVCWTEKI